MCFLIRVAFWLSIVVLLLPTGTNTGASSGPQVGAADALAAAGAAVSDMRQFCTRQPEACDLGSQAAVAFGQKAQASAKMLYEFLSEQLANERADAPSQDSLRTPPAARRRSVETTGTIAGSWSQDTLTPSDKALPWRGPHRS